MFFEMMQLSFMAVFSNLFTLNLGVGRVGWFRCHVVKTFMVFLQLSQVQFDYIHCNV